MEPTTLVMNRSIILRSRPRGEATLDNFALVSHPVPSLQEKQALVRHHFLSVDPYMRRRMDDEKSYAKPQPLDEVMMGGTVGEVVASRATNLPIGTFVVGTGGWQEYGVITAESASAFRVVSATRLPLSIYLGAVGMPGVTAWYGVVKVGRLKRGETILVSAASGAVGSAAAAIAKARGCRVVGIAGGPDKCDYATRDLGYDACIDYKQSLTLEALAAEIRKACPSGVDCLFENVGGIILDAGMRHMNPFARIALCGLIAGYEGEPLPMSNPSYLLWNRVQLEGFIVGEHKEVWPEALAELEDLALSGKLAPKETVTHGIESAPAAFLGMLKGQNLGKQVVKLF